jgi:hypothetical protein
MKRPRVTLRSLLLLILPVGMALSIGVLTKRNAQLQARLRESEARAAALEAKGVWANAVAGLEQIAVRVEPQKAPAVDCSGDSGSKGDD